MTLKEYEKLREESRKLLAKTELRKAEIDEELENMQQISSKKTNDEIFAKLVRASPIFTLAIPSLALLLLLTVHIFIVRVLIRINAKIMLTRRRKLRRYALYCSSGNS